MTVMLHDDDPLSQRSTLHLLLCLVSDLKQHPFEIFLLVFKSLQDYMTGQSQLYFNGSCMAESVLFIVKFKKTFCAIYSCAMS